MEKIVKGATKIKPAAPKSKYVEPILSATHGGEAGVAEIFRTLQLRLRDSTWTIVFKALIIVHLMIREGRPDVTLSYLADSPRRLAISNFTEVQTQGSNIRHYADYLLERVRGYASTKSDVVRASAGRIKTLSVEKGLLRETELIQDQIRALIRCDLLAHHDSDNEIATTAFRLLTMDLLELYKIMNEATMNVLEHYLQMSKPDAERALNIYKTFTRQTEQVVRYLSVARQYQAATRLEIPTLKHAPTSLTSSLEDYLNDPDFEVNRRQYLAQQEAKKSGKSTSSSKPTSRAAEKPVDTSFPDSKSTATTTVTSPPAKGPPADLIDFFDSIEQNQQPMAQQPNISAQQAPIYSPNQPYVQGGVAVQPTGYNPFLQQQTGQQFVPQQQPQHQQQPQVQPLQPDFTGAGFGGYTAQPQPQYPPPQQYTFQSSLSSIPQNAVASFEPQAQILPQQNFQPQLQPLQAQQTSTNPFRQSTMATGPMSPGFSSASPNLHRQSTNPFAKGHSIPQPQEASQGFALNSNNGYTPSPPPIQTQQQELQSSAFFSSPTAFQPTQPAQFPSATPIQAQQTGTNPFAKNRLPAPAASPIAATATGSTNPFRQSAFVNQQTGQGWQHSSQGTLFGVDVNSVQTVPVFPRPGQG